MSNAEKKTACTDDCPLYVPNPTRHQCAIAQLPKKLDEFMDLIHDQNFMVSTKE